MMEHWEGDCMGGVELSAEAIARVRRTERLGRPVIFFERVGSTNDVAHQQALAGAAEGLLVVADEQTSGRGRMGRSWWAPKGSSLLFSVLLRPALPAVQAGQLTMCLGLGAVEAIESATGLRPALKWPNDLLLEGRKLGGMLAELRTAGDRVEYAVLGLGLNVNLGFEEAANSTACERWISLSTVLGHDVDRVELLAEILARCQAWYGLLAPAETEAASVPETGTPAPVWRPSGPGSGPEGSGRSRRLEAGPGWREAGEQIHAAWAARLDTLGRYITVSGAAGQLRGRAVGVSLHGALLLETDDGETQEAWGGDVSILATASGAGHETENDPSL
jgi:biotin-[acetyl-CoA-carboxylase] ligase BirA-like protein